MVKPGDPASCPVKIAGGSGRIDGSWLLERPGNLSLKETAQGLVLSPQATCSHSHEFIAVDGLGDIVIATGVQAMLAIFDPGMGGEGDDRTRA